MKKKEMNATKLIDDLIAKLPDWRGKTFAELRKIIRDADPKIIEEWKWMGTPVWSRDGIICIADAFKDKVKVTFHNGASLADPDKIFNNGLNGNKWRSIDLYQGDKINAKSLKNLVKSAVAFNKLKAKPANKTGGKVQKQSRRRASMTKKQQSELHNKAVKAMREAVRKVVKEHKTTGTPLTVWKNGKIAHIPAK